jgi:hypothetical protein
MKNLVFLLLIAFSTQILGQSLQFKLNQDIKVSTNKGILKNAWAGGLNAAQFSQIDLDADGIQDLVVFDRTNQKVFTYVNKSTKGGAIILNYAPTFESLFPAIENWFILCDYDGDQKKDLFTSTSAGVKVFHNVSSGANLKFELASEALYSEGIASRINLYVAASDIPAIEDVDGDGDIDILSFDPAGHYLEFHKNVSKEKSGKPGLQFQKVGDCWGNFIHNDCRDILFGVPCDVSGNTSIALNSILSPVKTMHTGNSLSFLDANQDGIKDLLFGHVTCPNLVYLQNSGSLGQANFLKADFDFPAKSPVSVPSFAAAFPLDLNGDGQVELLTSTNAADNGGYAQDFQNSISLYQFEKGEWVLNSSNFLQVDMLDVGEGASAVWWDGDQDGDLDFYVGNSGKRGVTGVRASIYFYENVGNAINPNLVFRSDDFGGFSKTIQGTDIHLSVADVHDSGRRQLIITCQTFLGPEIRSCKSNIDEFRKISLPGLASGERPYFMDWDQNGFLDVLVLERSGKIRNYDGLSMKLMGSDWGNFSKLLDWTLQSFVLADLDLDGRLEFVGLDKLGRLHVGKLAFNSQNIIWELSPIFEPFNFGQKAIISTSDWNQDGLMDLNIGLSTGGIQLLANKFVSEISKQLSDSSIQVWPNPSNDFIQVMVNESGFIELFDVTGKKFLTKIAFERALPKKIDLTQIPKGLYFLRFTSLKNQISVKKIVIH